jgi:hypothetical protein
VAKSKQYGLVMEPEIMEEIDATIAVMKEKGIAIVIGRGVVIKKAWANYKKSAEYKKFMEYES